MRRQQEHDSPRGVHLHRLRGLEHPTGGNRTLSCQRHAPGTLCSPPSSGGDQLVLLPASSQATYAKWAEAVPPEFRFPVKVPKTITHESKLAQATSLLDTFLGEVGGLGTRLGVLLVQLPPSLRFDHAVARRFFADLRARHAGAVVCEPRHPAWFAPDAETLLREMRVARVAADPASVPGAARSGGWEGVAYYRLHGSPKAHYSAYTAGFLESLAVELANKTKTGADVWCIFDNTAAGSAMTNALALLDLAREAGAAEKRRLGYPERPGSYSRWA